MDFALLFGLLGSDTPSPVEFATAKTISFLMSLNADGLLQCRSYDLMTIFSLGSPDIRAF